MEFAVVKFNGDGVMRILVNGPDKTGQVKTCILLVRSTLRSDQPTDIDIVCCLSKVYSQVERIDVFVVATVHVLFFVCDLARPSRQGGRSFVFHIH